MAELQKCMLIIIRGETGTARYDVIDMCELTHVGPTCVVEYSMTFKETAML